MRRHVTGLVLGAVLLSGPCLAAGRSAGNKARKRPCLTELEAASLNLQTPPPIERISASPTAVTGPVPIGVEGDVYCSGWLGDSEDKFPGLIASAEYVESQHSFIQGDVVYLDVGAAQGVEAGQEFWVVRPERAVYKWGSVRDVLGHIYASPGRIRVMCAQDDGAIAEIVSSCSDIVIGDRILPFEPIPIPLVRRTRPYTSCDPPSGKMAGHIVDVRDSVTPIGTDTIVFLDLGDNDGVAPGDFLTVFRLRVEPAGLRTILGEAAVLTTRAKSAVAIITVMRDSMALGDQVELK